MVQQMHLQKIITQPKRFASKLFKKKLKNMKKKLSLIEGSITRNHEKEEIIKKIVTIAKEDYIDFEDERFFYFNGINIVKFINFKFDNHYLPIGSENYNKFVDVALDACDWVCKKELEDNTDSYELKTIRNYQVIYTPEFNALCSQNTQFQNFVHDLLFLLDDYLIKLTPFKRILLPDSKFYEFASASTYEESLIKMFDYLINQKYVELIIDINPSDYTKVSIIEDNLDVEELPF